MRRERRCVGVSVADDPRSGARRAQAAPAPAQAVTARGRTPDARRPTIGQAQRLVDAWIRERGGYWSDLSQYVRLVEEVGELGRELNHRLGDKPRQEKDRPGSVTDELGDVFFIVLLQGILDGF